MTSDAVHTAYELFLRMACSHAKDRGLDQRTVMGVLFESLDPDSDAARLADFGCFCTACEARMPIKAALLDADDASLHCMHCHSESLVLDCEQNSVLQ